VAVAWTALSLLTATVLGPRGFAAATVGLLLAWAYSAPPLRLKRNGWWGNLACGISYEGLAWLTGAAVMAGGQMPTPHSMGLAALYSLGAHGIMTPTSSRPWPATAGWASARCRCGSAWTGRRRSPAW
jgi:chlorophyll synthase